MKKDPTEEQAKILDESGSCVVIARPGSGKTFTISHKIASILSPLPWYKGVIAISYTNKASEELKERTLRLCADKRNSFFGTIDKFFVAEIIIPFLRQQAGLSKNPLNLVKFHESEYLTEFDGALAGICESEAELTDDQFNQLVSLYTLGEIVVETFGKLAVYLLKNDLGVKAYITARFSHIIIDEYQDCGLPQHQFFCECRQLGLVGIAVGDIDQSIFYFAKKDSKYLYLLSEDKSMKVYGLTLNHRCHKSISNYSVKFMYPTMQIEKEEELRVFVKEIVGDEEQICRWIDRNLEPIKKKFSILRNSEMVILGRNKGTLDRIRKYLKAPIYSPIDTKLDNSNLQWSRIFCKTLFYIYGPNDSAIDLADDYLSLEHDRISVDLLCRALLELKRRINFRIEVASDYIEEFIRIAQLVAPKDPNDHAVDLLTEVIAEPHLLKSFLPPRDEEIQLMTVHKSKGLEFKVVFHLDLYNWVLPGYKALKNNDNKELTQDKNLHYVGITRAVDAVIMCVGSKRYNSGNEEKRGERSIFLGQPHLQSLFKSLNT